MKKLWIGFTLFTLIFGISVHFVEAVTDTDVNVSLTVLFDENNEVPVTIEEKPYGHTMRMDSQFNDDDYTFAFWVVNGVVKYDYAVDHEFILTHNLTLQAVYSPSDKHAVLFMDSNGQLLESQYIADGQNASEYSGALPSKPGYVIADPMWSSSLETITTDTVLVLQYQKDDFSEYTVNVLDGTGDGIYEYNEVITINANAPSESYYFTHWEMNGEVVSYEKYFTFTVMEDMTLVAQYASEPAMKLPLVTISNALDLRTGYDSYRGQFYLPNGYEMIEYGMIASTAPTTEAIHLGDANVEKMQGFTHTISSNEWLFSFNEQTYHTVRSYLVVRNSQNEIITLYSNHAYYTEATSPYYEDFSPFVGSSTSYVTETFTGISGVTWTVTDARKSLGGYEIDGGGIMFRVPGTIEGTLPDGLETLSLDILMGFTGDLPSDRTVEIYANNVLIGSHTLETTNQVETLTINAIGLEGPVNLSIRATGLKDKQITVNNLNWSSSQEGNSYLLNTTSNINASYTVSGNGPFYAEGSSVTITADPVTGYDFVHWTNALTGAVVSTDSTYTLTMNNHTHLYAYYEVQTPEDNEFNVVLDASISGVDVNYSPEHGIVNGTEVTVVASSVEGYRFEHWWDNDYQRVASVSQTYSFEIIRNRNLTAIFLANDEYDIYLSSNIEEAIVSKAVGGPFSLNDTVEITTSAPSNFTFVHWYDYYNDQIVSTNQTVNVTVNESRHIVAVYQYIEAPSVYYQTGFENDTKTSYASDFAEIDGQLWWFENALIGSLQNDKVNGTRAVRIQGQGFIETYFSTPYLYQISFDYAYYGTDASSDFNLSVSTNQIDWVLVDTVTNGSTLQTFTYTFDDVFYGEHDFGPEDSLYIRIKLNASGTNRGNIDDVVITQEKIITPPLPQDLLESEIPFPNNSTRLELTLAEVEYYYSLGDLWDGAQCTVTDLQTGEDVDCLIEGSVDTSTRGEYTVTYYAIDEDGFYASQTLTKVVFTDASLLDYTYDAYYTGINGLYGDDLILALRDILWDGLTLQTYDAARQILEITDRDPNNSSNVLTIYDRQSVLGTWDNGDTWNREHVWPNSRLGLIRVSGGDRSIATDLHNLRAADPSVNSSRGNLPFNYDGESNSWYPGPDRGDVARIYFYMMVMWHYLVLTDDVHTAGDAYTLEGAVHGYLSALIYFHYDDPVDAFEINRNNLIYGYQNNRNPFIDYPHLIDLIYFDHPNIPES